LTRKWRTWPGSGMRGRYIGKNERAVGSSANSMIQIPEILVCASN
jgi:hypothetical protein